MLEFVSRLAPPSEGQVASYWFIFAGEKLLVRREGERTLVPMLSGPAELGLAPERVVYLGSVSDAVEEGGEQTPCYAAEIAADAPLPGDVIAEGLRALYPLLDEPFMGIAGRAVQLVAFDRTNQFCGQCGGRMVDEAHERAKRCPRCGLMVYPRLSPAIIIAVTRRIDGRLHILLGRNHRFPTGRYSVLAGYVEPGETLEECAAREVCEEVGVDLENVRYFGSQPWPFPNSLMIGFTAEYAGGDIKLEESELADARWFTADQLPGIPPPYTIARRLIDWFIGQAG
ncbi:MAG: NAD(+) diphosphatase [Nitrososphaerales archaeon]